MREIEAGQSLATSKMPRFNDNYFTHNVIGNVTHPFHSFKNFHGAFAQHKSFFKSHT